MDENKPKDTKKNASKWLLISVAIGIAGSIIIVPLTYFQMIATFSHIFLVALTLGFWPVPCVLPLVAVRHPGASVIACAATGVITAVTTPYGLAAIPALVIEGAIAEIPFAVTRYRRWSAAQYYISGAVLAGFMGFLAPYILGVMDADMPMHLACMGIAMASSLVGVTLCRAIGTRIQRAGVLDE